MLDRLPRRRRNIRLPERGLAAMVRLSAELNELVEEVISTVSCLARTRLKIACGRRPTAIGSRMQRS